MIKKQLLLFFVLSLLGSHALAHDVIVLFDQSVVGGDVHIHYMDQQYGLETVSKITLDDAPHVVDGGLLVFTHPNGISQEQRLDGDGTITVSDNGQEFVFHYVKAEGGLYKVE